MSFVQFASDSKSKRNMFKNQTKAEIAKSFCFHVLYLSEPPSSERRKFLITLEKHKRPNTVNHSFSATLGGNMFLSTFPVYCCGSQDPLVEVVQPPACTTTWSPPNRKGFTTRHRVTGVVSISPLAWPLWQRHTRGFALGSHTRAPSVCCNMMEIMSYVCCHDAELVHGR